MNTPIVALANFLDERAGAVHALEAEAAALIHGQQDQAGYAAVMRRKAELLAAIAEDAHELLDALPQPLADAAAARLEQFSANAGNALRIGSVFYMAALLYPDEHRPGEPNNLDILAAEVRGWKA
jgi:hypothetical protein